VLRGPPSSPLFPYTTLFRSIAADVAAVRQDLAFQLLDQAPAHRLDHPGLAGDAQRRIGEGNHGLEPRQAVPCAEERAAQVADLRSEEHTSELQSRGHLVCRP